MPRKKTPPARPAARPRPQRTGRDVHVHLDPDLVARLLVYINRQQHPPTMTRVIEAALRDYLAARGF